MRILVIGSGGREHALCWVLSRTATVFCAPGNPGTAQCATNVPVDVNDHDAVVESVRQHGIDLTVIGPEAPLANGLADALVARGMRAFGPTADAARIESSKAFAKEIMNAAGVPTARSKSFTDAERAYSYIDDHAEPLVVKASGLAAGKGAVVCESREDARIAAGDMLEGRFGEAGSTVLIEEFMEGEEISVFVLTDGEHTLTLPASQDHKRLLEGDSGPNTGGMGAYCPVSIASDALMRRVASGIIEPTLHEMARVGSPFLGVLYAGLMVSPEGMPSVVEFNCRFGDPEAQVVLPACDLDWAEIFWNIADGTWNPESTAVTSKRNAVTTVLASEGYPAKPRKGAIITIPEDLPDNTILFHAGSKRVDGALVVSGGRVLAATGVGDTLAEAVTASRTLADAVDFDGKVYRRDIAWREEARHAAAS